MFSEKFSIVYFQFAGSHKFCKYCCSLVSFSEKTEIYWRRNHCEIVIKIHLRFDESHRGGLSIYLPTTKNNGNKEEVNQQKTIRKFVSIFGISLLIYRS